MVPELEHKHHSIKPHLIKQQSFFTFFSRFFHSHEGMILHCKTVHIFLFKFTWAVTQKVWSKVENGEWDWGETLFSWTLKLC